MTTMMTRRFHNNPLNRQRKSRACLRQSLPQCSQSQRCLPPPWMIWSVCSQHKTLSVILRQHLCLSLKWTWPLSQICMLLKLQPLKIQLVASNPIWIHFSRNLTSNSSSQLSNNSKHNSKWHKWISLCNRSSSLLKASEDSSLNRMSASSLTRWWISSNLWCKITISCSNSLRCPSLNSSREEIRWEVASADSSPLRPHSNNSRWLICSVGSNLQSLKSKITTGSTTEVL